MISPYSHTHTHLFPLAVKYINTAKGRGPTKTLPVCANDMEEKKGRVEGWGNSGVIFSPPENTGVHKYKKRKVRGFWRGKEIRGGVNEATYP